MRRPVGCILSDPLCILISIDPRSLGVYETGRGGSGWDNGGIVLDLTDEVGLSLSLLSNESFLGLFGSLVGSEESLSEPADSLRFNLEIREGAEERAGVEASESALRLFEGPVGRDGPVLADGLSRFAGPEGGTRLILTGLISIFCIVYVIRNVPSECQWYPHLQFMYECVRRLDIKLF